MDEFREFVADLMERHNAAVERIEPDRLRVLAPAALRYALGWPELADLSFGAGRGGEAIRIGLESDWLDRFGALMAERGRWAIRRLTCVPEAPGDPDRVLARGLELHNAVYKLDQVELTTTRCAIMTFRYSAVSDEKREGLFRIGLNLCTGAVLDELVAAMVPMLDRGRWEAPDPAARDGTREGWSQARLEAKVRSLLDYRMSLELEPSLRATLRRLERDRKRVHEYHQDLRDPSLRRMAALAGGPGKKTEDDLRREQLRVAAIERQYHSKLDDLRDHYATRVAVEWVQSLELLMPVQRFSVVVRRRKAERMIQLDWHPLARMLEPPPCDWGAGLSRARMVCDDKLHMTELAGHTPCDACAKVWCRACHPFRCPRCGAAPVNRTAASEGSQSLESGDVGASRQTTFKTQ